MTTQTEPSKTHSLALGYLFWLFGFLGAHRFYFGKKLSGTLYFFTLGLFGVGWLVDLFLMPSMARRAKQHYHHGPYSYDVAWVLQVFFGYLGLHRFYLRQWITGLLWLCTAGLFGIGYVYDYLTLNEHISIANRETAS